MWQRFVIIYIRKSKTLPVSGLNTCFLPLISILILITFVLVVTPILQITLTSASATNSKLWI